MENLTLNEYVFHDITNIKKENLQLIQELNDEIVSINYLQNIMIYSFPSNEYINIKDLLFFKETNILAISKNQLILISIKILETLLKLQELKKYYNQITKQNIWIWVSKPLSSKYNNQIEFKAFFSTYPKVSQSQGNQDLSDFLSVKQVITQILKIISIDDKILIQQNAKQIILDLNQYLNKNEQEQLSGSYDPKLIEQFLNNKKLSDEEFKKQFGISNGSVLRNIILNWAIKYQHQFIKSLNSTEISIKELVNKLDIDGWFYEQFQQLKQNRDLEDFLFYSFQVSEALNDIKNIQNNSMLELTMNFENQKNSIIDYRNQLHQSLFPKLSQRFNNKDTIILISSYQEVISEIIDQSQLVINNFYKKSSPITFNKIETYKFYKQGLNILDDYLVKISIDVNSFFGNSQELIKVIKQKLGQFLIDEIFKIFQNLIHKCNTQIANQLFYNENDIY